VGRHIYIVLQRILVEMQCANIRRPSKGLELKYHYMIKKLLCMYQKRDYWTNHDMIKSPPKTTLKSKGKRWLPKEEKPSSLHNHENGNMKVFFWERIVANRYVPLLFKHQRTWNSQTMSITTISSKPCLNHFESYPIIFFCQTLD